MPFVQVRFPKGVQAKAEVSGFEILTDQSVEDGGHGEAPTPYALFLSSIATCAGYYALAFCRQRDLPTDGLGIALDIDRNSETRRLDKVRLVIQTPDDFPEKYKNAILRAAGMCSVKKALLDPPEFEMNVE